MHTLQVDSSCLQQELSNPRVLSLSFESLKALFCTPIAGIERYSESNQTKVEPKDMEVERYFTPGLNESWSQKFNGS